jgi:CubicO group peptidase (beta-lactamase class C family)
MVVTAVRRRAVAREEPAGSGVDFEGGLKEILNRHPAVGLAVGVVRHGRLELFHGHGFADIASKSPVTADTVFRIGSITKTFTAVAVMQLVERGLIDLDAPANDYLSSYKLVPAQPTFRATTVRQLLTHTGGVPEQARISGVLRANFGQTVELGRPVPSLGEFYDGALRVVVEPGTVFIYGDHGFATLGQIVEDLTGTPLREYFREHMFAPLGMADSDFVRSEHVASRLATGYRLGSAGPVSIVDRQLITAAAGSIYSSPRDMARYAAALLGGGSNEHGRILGAETVAAMFAPQFQAHPRSPGMGLSFFRGEVGGHRAVEHQGILPGFNSQLWLAPDDGLAVLAFTNGARNAVMWMPVEFAALSNELLGGRLEQLRTDVPHHPEIWGDICGWYSLPVPISDPRSRLYGGAGAEVLQRGAELVFRMLAPVPMLFKGFPLHPDDERDPYLFRIDLSRFGTGTTRVLFGRDGRGRMIMVPEMGVMPVPLCQQPRARNPRLWATRSVALAALGLAARRVARRRPRSVSLRGARQGTSVPSAASE